MIWAYFDLLEIKRHSFALFLSSGIFSLLANHGIFIMVFLGILLHYIVFAKQKEIKKHIASACFLLALLFSAIVWYFKGAVHLEPSLFNQIYPNISYYIRAVNKYVLPYRFYFLIFLCIIILKPKKIVAFFQKEKNQLRKLYLFGFIFVVSLFMLTFERHRYLRYIINLVPLLVIIHAYILSKFFKWSKPVATILLILVVFTNMLNESWIYLLLKPVKPLLVNVFQVKKDSLKEIDTKAKVRFYLFNYIYEITHKYEGPIAGIVTFLNRNAKPGDRFKTPYNVAGIMYYTGLVGSKDFSRETYPEWIIPRRDWLSSEFYKSDYHKNILQRYEAIKLNAVDIPWENRPDDLEYHKFRTVKEGPPLIIFKRKH